MKDLDLFQKWLTASQVQPKENHYLPNMRFDQYSDAPGINGSTFLKDTPAEMKFEAMRPREPDYNLALGELVHMAILEPDFFEGDTVEERFQYSPTKTLDSKAALSAFAADPSKPLVTPEMVDKARYMRDAAIGDKTGNKLVKQLLSAKADKELSGFAWDEEQQILLKTRVDFRPKKGNMICDIKTCASVNEMKFWSDLRKFQYHCKAALYLDVDAMITREAEKELFILVAISGPKGPSQGIHDAPYLCRAFNIGNPVQDMSLVAEGRSIYRSRLAMFSHAAKTNDWEGWENQSELEHLNVFRPRSVAKKLNPDEDD